MSSPANATWPEGDRARAEEEHRVLSTFFRDGRLRSLPSKHNRRLIVLRYIAQTFQLGRTYTEQEVNETLLQFHPDYCTVRRELVDNGFLGRSSGAYWRGR